VEANGDAPPAPLIAVAKAPGTAMSNAASVSTRSADIDSVLDASTLSSSC
jgi:hypothetical protein